MIATQPRAGGGVLVVRSRDTRRTRELDRRILENGWVSLLLVRYGELLLEAWGPAPACEQAEDPNPGMVSIADAAAELGIGLDELVDRMLEDGLLLEVDGELVASPHPSIMKFITNRSV